MRSLLIAFALVGVAVGSPVLYGYGAINPYAYPYAAAAPLAYSAIAAPAPVAAPIAYFAPYAAPYAAPVSSQFHAQDELGQYSYGYAGGPSAKSEVKSWDGVTRGGYSYVDAEGKLQTVNYVADPIHGFRVAATNLPVAPVAPEAPVVPAVPDVPVIPDSPEVAEAKAAHFAAHEEAKARLNA